MSLTEAVKANISFLDKQIKKMTIEDAKDR